MIASQYCSYASTRSVQTSMQRIPMAIETTSTNTKYYPHQI